MARFPLPKDRPAIMGVLNVTPDSFSDGGSYATVNDAVSAGLRMVDDGADLVDVGGESTRPGAPEVPVEEELQRVVPVVNALVKAGVQVSIDTSKPRVARECVEAGASVVNDVTALADPLMVDLCVQNQPTVCLMHMKGNPRTMQQNPHYDDVVREVSYFLVDRAITAEESGVPHTNLWIDPGIGFGKTLSHNLELLRNTATFVETGYPVLIGVSRKSFIGKVLDSAGALDRLEGSLAAQAVAQMQGARIIRTHDVQESLRIALMVSAIMGESL